MFVAIDTATDVGSVALGTGAELAGEIVLDGRSRHAETLLPSLEVLLHSAGIDRRAVQGVVVGAGPGSFTGVRIAAATARGLAAGLCVPLYAYSSLAAVALDAAGTGPVCALFDARRGEVYAACYEPASALRTLMEPEALHVSELLRRMAAIRPRYVGEGAIRYAAELGIEPPPPVPPRASALLRLLASDMSATQAGRIAEPAGWEPTYIRSSGAERGVAG